MKLRVRRRRRPRAKRNVSPSRHANPSQPESSAQVCSDEYQEDPAEPVRVVREMLSHLVPYELTLDIMDIAEYYPVVRAKHSELVSIAANEHTSHDSRSSRLYLVSPPLPAGREGESWRMKKVTWTIEGHDQGWGGEYPGTFRAAYSWYEACIFRPSPTSDGGLGDDAKLRSLLQARHLFLETEHVKECLNDINWTLVPNGDRFVWRIQGNRVAKKDFQRYTVEWVRTGRTVQDGRGAGDGTGFLDALQPGDRVGLWMRALYPGWENYIRRATVDLVYNVQ
ncbi:hypothetical protein C8Q80DRAFT_749675 [Daedaleopsis nitida]|nr:hypothetical protein C8Q80DRAFT_749675 [Daedaleopsis nitida]